MAKQVIDIGTTANDGTGTPLRSAFDMINDNFTELYTDDAGDVGSITATAPIARDSATGAVTISLNDNGITQAKLEPRYKAVTTSSATGDQNINAGTHSSFRLTGNVTTATLTIQNMKKGQVIDILFEGTLSSAVITLAADFSSETFNKVGSTNFDQSSKNVITVLCVDDTDGAAILNYSVQPLALNDPTPAD